MLEEAIKTIRIQNWKWTRYKAIKHLNYYLNLVEKKYPQGLESNNYFVIPGCEHIANSQPIIRYNPGEGAWEITINNIFNQTKII